MPDVKLKGRTLSRVCGLFLPQFEVNLSRHKGLSAYVCKARGGKLCYHHIVHALGAVAYEQLPHCVAANNQANMGIVRV